MGTLWDVPPDVTWVGGWAHSYPNELQETPQAPISNPGLDACTLVDSIFMTDPGTQ